MTAIYADGHLTSHVGNPLLHAQMPLTNRDEVEAELRRRTDRFRPEWLKEPHMARSAKAAYMRQHLSVVRPEHVDVVMNILKLQFTRYYGVDVFARGYFSGAVSSLPEHQADCHEFDAEGDEHLARNLTILGPSGSGKTTVLKMAATVIPQVVVHNCYNGKNLFMKQLNWVRVICPKRSGAKAVWTNFYQAFNRALNVQVKTGSWTEALLEEKIAADARVSGLGFIIIDEIQNLKIQDNKLASETLAAFTRLNEITGIPLVLVGTQDVAKLLKTEMHTARRAAGSLPWKTMSPGEVWDKWLKEVLTKGLVRKPLKFSKEISEYFFEYSQGVADPAVALFYKANELVLDSGRDEILCSDLDQAQKHLHLMDQALDKVREERRKNLVKRQLAAEQTTKQKNKDNKGLPSDPAPDFKKAASR